MSKPHPASTETSVMTSLQELTRIESGRLRTEAEQQALERDRKQAAALAAQAERQAQERAQVIARQEVEAARARDERMEAARRAGREQAAVEVARIEAQARAQLEIDNAVRAHQLNELRVRRDTGRRTREYVLAATLALVACVGGAILYQSNQAEVTQHQALDELSGRNAALLQEREESKRVQFRALNARYTALLARFPEKNLEAARSTAIAARDAVSDTAPTHAQLSTFASAMDALEERGTAFNRLRQLDARHADLDAWASSVRRTGATRDAEKAAARAKAPGATDADRDAYALALNHLQSELAQARGTTASAAPSVAGVTVSAGTCQAGDPGCGFDGTPLF